MWLWVRLGVVGAGLGLVWGWFGGVVGGQWGGEIQVTIQAGLLSHWPARKFVHNLCIAVTAHIFGPHGPLWGPVAAPPFWAAQNL